MQGEVSLLKQCFRVHNELDDLWSCPFRLRNRFLGFDELESTRFPTFDHLVCCWCLDTCDILYTLERMLDFFWLS
jgi:hypothetical protein